MTKRAKGRLTVTIQSHTEDNSFQYLNEISRKLEGIDIDDLNVALVGHKGTCEREKALLHINRIFSELTVKDV